MTSVAPTSPLVPTRSGLDLRALWTLYVLTLRQHLRGKRWLVMGLLFLIPSAIAVIIRVTEPRAPVIFMEFMCAFMFIPQALLPLVALTYASGVIQDELEEQTITYLLIRPIPRSLLYTVKMLATLTTTVALTAIFTAITYAAVYAGRADVNTQQVIARCVHAIGIHSLGVVAYCCLFGLFSLLTKRALVMGIMYTAVFEGLLANLPLSVRLITVIYYTRIIAYRTMKFVGMGPAGNEDIAAIGWQLDVQNDPKLLEHPDVSTAIWVLLISSLVCTVIAAFICSRREFYVKTPEKSA